MHGGMDPNSMGGLGGPRHMEPNIMMGPGGPRHMDPNMMMGPGGPMAMGPAGPMGGPMRTGRSNENRNGPYGPYDGRTQETAGPRPRLMDPQMVGPSMMDGPMNGGIKEEK